MKQFPLFDVYLPCFISILHRITIINPPVVGEVLSLYAVHHAFAFLTTCPGHGDRSAGGTVGEV